MATKLQKAFAARRAADAMADDARRVEASNAAGLLEFQLSPADQLRLKAMLEMARGMDKKR